MSSARQKQTEGRRSRTIVTSLLFPENLHVEHGAGLGTVAVTPGSTSVRPALRSDPMRRDLLPRLITGDNGLVAGCHHGPPVGVAIS
jgi:hypothetical protein